MTDIIGPIMGSAETILITLAAGVLFFIVNVGYRKRSDDRTEINGKIKNPTLKGGVCLESQVRLSMSSEVFKRSLAKPL